MRKKIILLLAALALSLLTLAGCNKEKEVKTVDWYMDPANKAAYEAKLAECKNNPGGMKDDPNCMNAMTAQHKLFTKVPPPNIR